MLIPLAAFVGYFIESIFGFGGTIILLTIVSNFIPIKSVVILALVASVSASSYIILQSKAHINKNLLLRILAISILGVFLGVYLVDVLESEMLFKIFSAILIIYGLYGFFKPDLKFTDWLKKLIIFLGGVAMGLFSTGGPLILMGIRQEFANKQELRATMACYFLTTNIFRFIQLTIQKVEFGLSYEIYLVTIALVWFAIFLGYKLHLKLPEEKFNKGLNFMFALIGFFYLIK